MDSVVVSAKTIEKAIEEGLLLLNTTIENVDVNIISEGGLLKKAKVELTLTPEALAEKAEKEKRINARAEKELEQKPAVTKPMAEKTATKHQDKVKEAVKPSEENSELDHEQKTELEKIEKELKELTGTAESTKTATEPAELKATVEEVVTSFLKGLIYAFNINADVEIESKSNEIYVRIVGENLGVLIGYHGDSLDAIQYLLNNHAFNKTGTNKKIILDIESYRSKRAETLKTMAENLAKKVTASKRSYKLEPMNSFERKVIHSHLQGFEHISTHSEGKEPNRFLVINYVD
jgi:spoIIIJ-associated protein